MWTGLKNTLRPFLPAALLEARHQTLRARERRRNAGRSTQEIFESIYAEGKWSGSGLEGGSGSGSDECVARSYVEYVNGFLRDHPEIRRIVDIGCGDLRVARNFELGEGQTYLGTDIVAPLVAFHHEHNSSLQRSFMHLDAAVDPLPEADLYLVRQVLQHLSNDNAARVLEKVRAGRYALVTEHHPAPDRLTHRNLDKPDGPDVRVYDGSGLYLEYPPFAVPNVEIVLQTSPLRGLVAEGERLTTYLVRGTAS
jgi:SAM-dependent methyltransferase